MAYHLEEVDQAGGADYDDAAEEQGSPLRSGRWLRLAGACAVMALFAGGLWFAYIEGVRHGGRSAESGEIPLIRADVRPFKVKPENPGGMPAPNGDMLIYGEQRPGVEHLLPPPEQPMARPVPPPPPAPAVAAPPPQGATTAVEAPLPATATPAQPAPAAATAAVLPPGSAAPHPRMAAPAATTPQPARPQPSAAHATPAAVAHRPQPATDLIAQRIEELGLVPSDRPASRTAGRSGAGRSPAWRLQLGSVRSESEAHGQWERLKHSNPDLLGRLSAVAVRAEVGDKGVYYRIQAGPFSDASAADRACSELRARHLACMPVR
jgi:SPOR domain